MEERGRKLRAEIVLEHTVDLKTQQLFLDKECCPALVQTTDMATFLATKHRDCSKNTNPLTYKSFKAKI